MCWPCFRRIIERRRAVGRLDHVVAEIAQNVDRERAYLRLVLDDENLFAAGCERPRPRPAMGSSAATPSNRGRYTFAVVP